MQYNFTESWYPHWPLQSVSKQFEGIETLCQIKQNVKKIKCMGPEGQIEKIKAYCCRHNEKPVVKRSTKMRAQNNISSIAENKHIFYPKLHISVAGNIKK